MSRKIHCSILTPEQSIFDGDVAFSIVQVHDGEMGFLYNHAPLISELGYGEVRLKDDDIKESFIVEGGIVEIKNNKLIILAESATKTEDLQKEELEKKLQELDNKFFEPYSKEKLVVQAEQSKLKMKLKVLERQ